MDFPGVHVLTATVTLRDGYTAIKGNARCFQAAAQIQVLLALYCSKSPHLVGLPALNQISITLLAVLLNTKTSESYFWCCGLYKCTKVATVQSVVAMTARIRCAQHGYNLSLINRAWTATTLDPRSCCCYGSVSIN